MLHVVYWERHRLLIGCSDHDIQLLAESPAGRDAEAMALPVMGNDWMRREHHER